MNGTFLINTPFQRLQDFWNQCKFCVCTGGGGGGGFQSPLCEEWISSHGCFSAQMSAQEWISGHQTLSLMLSDSFAVFDPDYPEHPTVGWGVIRWERIPAIYSTLQLSCEVFVWLKLQLSQVSVPKHWCFWWVLGPLPWIHSSQIQLFLTAGTIKPHCWFSSMCQSGLAQNLGICSALSSSGCLELHKSSIGGVSFFSSPVLHERENTESKVLLISLRWRNVLSIKSLRFNDPALSAPLWLITILSFIFMRLEGDLTFYELPKSSD